MRRILYTLAIIVPAGLVIVIGFMFRDKVPGIKNPFSGDTVVDQGIQFPKSGNPSPQPGTAEATAKKFGVVLQSPIADYFVDSDNNLYFVEPGGAVSSFSGGQITSLNAGVISNLIEASFSFDGKKLLVAFGDKFLPQFSVFETASSTWRPLESGIKAASWSPNNNQVAYLHEKGGSSVITTLDMGNPKAKPKEYSKMNIEDVSFRWSRPNQILIGDKGSAYTSGNLWGFNLQDSRFSSILSEQPGLDFLWDNTDDQGLAMTSNFTRRGGRVLFLRGESDGSYSSQEFSLSTFPSKCVFGTTSSGGRALFCAVPNQASYSSTAVLPDAYYKKEFFTADDFYEIDLSNGNLTPLLVGSPQSMDATNLKIYNNKLFFVNRIDQKLYAIDLSN